MLLCPFLGCAALPISVSEGNLNACSVHIWLAVALSSSETWRNYKLGWPVWDTTNDGDVGRHDRNRLLQLRQRRFNMTMEMCLKELCVQLIYEGALSFSHIPFCMVNGLTNVMVLWAATRTLSTPRFQATGWCLRFRRSKIKHRNEPMYIAGIYRLQPVYNYCVSSTLANSNALKLLSTTLHFPGIFHRKKAISLIKSQNAECVRANF